MQYKYRKGIRTYQNAQEDFSFNGKTYMYGNGPDKTFTISGKASPSSYFCTDGKRRSIKVLKELEVQGKLIK